MPAPRFLTRGRVRAALSRILAEHGVRGLYKGLGATLVQVVPGLAFNFCFYDTFKRLALQAQARAEAAVKAEADGGSGSGVGSGSGGGRSGGSEQALPSPSPLTSAASACAAGLVTSTLTFPLDVVRRRLQVRVVLSLVMRVRHTREDGA